MDRRCGPPFTCTIAAIAAARTHRRSEYYVWFYGQGLPGRRGWYPQADSNRCFHLERVASWSPRRWGLPTLRGYQRPHPRSYARPDRARRCRSRRYSADVCRGPAHPERAAIKDNNKEKRQRSGPARERRARPFVRFGTVYTYPLAGDGHRSERLRVHRHAAAVGGGGHGRVPVSVGDGRRHGLLCRGRGRLHGGRHRRSGHRRSRSCHRRRWRHRRSRGRSCHRRSRGRSCHGLGRGRSCHGLGRSGHRCGLSGRCGCSGRRPRLRRLGGCPHPCVLAASPPQEHGDRGSRDHRHEDETAASAASARHVHGSHVVLPSHECVPRFDSTPRGGVASRTTRRWASARILARVGRSADELCAGY